MLAKCTSCEKTFHIKLDPDKERELHRKQLETGKIPERQCFKCFEKEAHKEQKAE